MLGTCSGFLSTEQIKQFVEKLNRNDEQSLHAQWELAVLFGLSKTGTVAHEMTFGRRKPDVYWSHNGSACSIVADIRTVSDAGLEEENPREFYRLELRRRVRVLGLDPDHFSDYPVGLRVGPPGNQKMRLLYPKVSECNRLFGAEFKDFMQRVKDLKPPHLQCRISGEGFDVSISYDSRRRGYGGGNLSYTVYYSLTKNPVYRALQEKARQLRATGFSGPQGIILTDGGCDALRRQMRDPMGRTYTLEQVVRRFFANTTSIAFVASICVDRRIDLHSGFGPLQLVSVLYENAGAKPPTPNSASAALRTLPDSLPQPKLDGWNAANHLRNGWDGPHKSWYASIGLTMDRSWYEIKVSAGALLDFLAGKISREEFAEMHSGGVLEGDTFGTLLKRGFVISNVRFAALRDEDDDHVIVELRPDVSAGPFQVPGALPIKKG